ncbi:hypothetical protein [Chitinophaga defluvii]|uniref:Uncharacterized protein n=1 Tax=Chitinophaga defluvii TaxID=3163343 RepID=A0ABV2T0X4_9BACT
MIRIRGLLLFYRNLFWPTFIITLCCCHIVRIWGISTLGPLIWLKLLSDALAFYFLKVYRSKQLYFFYNLRLSYTILIVFSVIADLALFSLALSFTQIFLR